MNFPRIDRLINEYVGRSTEILRDTLVGVYLHGSSVMGCFNPQKSDIDLIIVVNGEISDDTKREFMDMTVELNARAPRKGIEMSIVKRDVCAPFVYPTPYELHFSAGHLQNYEEDSGDYIRNMKGTDKDLAAHFTVIRTRGRCLYGAPIDEVFAEVPRRDYVDSILFDVKNSKEEIKEYTMYLTLNLARVAAYLEDGVVFSKKEGGEWGLKNLPSEFHPVIKDALREYTESAEVIYDTKRAEEYADYMLNRILKSYDG